MSAGWGDACSTISSAVMAVIEPNRGVKRVRRQDASHLWIVEHQRDICNHKGVLLQMANLKPGPFFGGVKNKPYRHTGGLLLSSLELR